jgi:hypothetical protein
MSCKGTDFDMVYNNENLNSEVTPPCWYNRILFEGAPDEVAGIVAELSVPAAHVNRVLNHNFCKFSLAKHVPTPSPSDSTLVIAGMNDSFPVVSNEWAEKNWGCVSDMLDCETHSGYARDKSSFITTMKFFTYGGAPTIWAQKVFPKTAKKFPSLLVSLVAYSLNGNEALRITVGSDKTLVYSSTSANVDEILSLWGLPWDPLIAAPFEENPEILWVPAT